MNYKEYIDCLNLESLKILAETHSIDYMSSPAWTGNELTTIRSEVFRVVADADYIENIINQMDRDHKNILRIVFFSDEAVDQDSVIRKFNNLYGKDQNARSLIDSLWRMGLLIKFEMYYRNRPYVALVGEVRQAASRLVVQELLGQWAGGSLESYVNSNPFELAQDIYVFLSYVNNNEVRLTAKNVIFRKAAQKVEDLFVGKSDFMDQPEDDLFEMEYSERFLLINNFLYMIDMIVYNEGVVYLNESKVRKWLKLRLMDKMKAISNFVETYYLGNKREITEAINKIKLTLLNTYDTPISKNHLEELIKKYRADMNFNYLQSNYKKILNHMVLMGMVEILKDEEENLYYRLNKYGWDFYSNRTEAINEEEEKHFYIQPNFEVISTINLDPELRWELDEFCEIGRIEKTIHYWITKASIHRALSNEKNIEGILAFLKQYSKSGLPQNVEYSLKEWASSYGNVYMMDIVLLRCRAEELAKEISSIPTITENIIGKVTDKDLIINKAFAEDILDILVKKGYMAKAQILESESLLASEKERKQVGGRVSEEAGEKDADGSDMTQFTIDMRYLDKNAHYKKTVMDIKPPVKGEKTRVIASKVYSPSTFQAKEILERAIEQRKPVLIDYYSQAKDASSRIRIEPFKVEKEENGWMVHAHAQEQKMVFDIGNIQSIEFSNNN